MSMSAFQNTAPVLSQTATVAEPASLSVLYLPWEIWLQEVTLASNWAAVGPPGGGGGGGPGGGGGGGGVPPVSTAILSKSGAQPAVLPNFRVLLPALRVTVVLSVPGVLKLPVGEKLRVLFAPPL